MSVEHHFDGPGASDTDQAANAAFDAISAKLDELGHDPDDSWAIVMVLLPDGQPKNATVAAHFPGALTSERMLEHAVTQLQVLARECGYDIRLDRSGMN